MKNLTEKQKTIICKIENLLNIQLLEKSFFIKNKIIGVSINYNNLEQLRDYQDLFARMLKDYNIRCEPNGGKGLAIIF